MVAGIDFSVFLLDDASHDGTSEAVQLLFPDVHILEGDGSLFWGGGMHAAMKAAIAVPFDYMLWLNDDVVLAQHAVQRLLASYVARHGKPHIIVGSLTNPATGQIHYGGFRRSGFNPGGLDRVQLKGDDTVSCDTMNGNVVLLPKIIVDAVGLIDPVFIHQFGDIDYGYRAIKAGFQIRATCYPVGTCHWEQRERPWRRSGLSLLDRWRLLNRPLGLPPRPFLTFMMRHGGLPGLALAIFAYLKALAPTLHMGNGRKI